MIKPKSALFHFVVVFTGVLLAFYALDQLVMFAQGLPLNWDLSPAQ